MPAVLAKLFSWISSVARHWGTLVTGGVFIGLLGVWQGTGHSVPHWLYWLIAILALFIACFRAWLDEHLAREAALWGKDAVSSDSWIVLYEKRSELVKELDLLEIPPPPASIKDTAINDLAFEVRYMTHGESHEAQKKDRRIKRIREELDLIEAKLKNCIP